jgi:hypothetical protein
MIRSMRTVLCHTMLGVLGDRGISMRAIAEWCRIPITDLHRLAEFGSPLDAGAAERLIDWGTRMIDISSIARAASRNRVGDEHVRPQVRITRILAVMSPRLGTQERSPDP